MPSTPAFYRPKNHFWRVESVSSSILYIPNKPLPAVLKTAVDSMLSLLAVCPHR